MTYQALLAVKGSVEGDVVSKLIRLSKISETYRKRKLRCCARGFRRIVSVFTGAALAKQ